MDNFMVLPVVMEEEEENNEMLADHIPAEKLEGDVVIKNCIFMVKNIIAFEPEQNKDGSECTILHTSDTSTWAIDLKLSVIADRLAVMQLPELIEKIEKE